MIRHYIIRREKLKDAYKERNHSEILIHRPTPWRTFLDGFINHDKYAFAIMDDAELGRFLSNHYAIYYKNGILQSNGDSIQVQDWSILNVCKFCIEGFQYKTFWEFWKWTWNEKR